MYGYCAAPAAMFVDAACFLIISTGTIFYHGT